LIPRNEPGGNAGNGSSAKAARDVFRTVAELARGRRLPLDFLADKMGLADLPGGGISVPYFDEAGNDLFIRERDNPKRRDRFYQPAGVSLVPYGLWRLKSACKAHIRYVVEGESDCWAGWFHGLPCLGLPGSNSPKCLTAEHLQEVETLYVLREPDKGGEAFIPGVQKRLRAIGWTGDAFELRMPDGLKDLAELHVDDPDRFLQRLEIARAASVSLAAEPEKSAVPQDWPELIPLAEVPEAPAFPVEILPAQVRRLVEETVWAMNCPPDLVTVPVLALAGGAVGNAWHFAITRSYSEAPCLFAAIVSPPGTLKTPVLKPLRRPLDQAQKRYINEWKTRMKEWERDDKESRGPRPVLRRCIVSDTTTESLGITLSETPRGVVMVRDELVGLVSGLNQYKAGGKGSDRQTYLQLWAGDNILIDRKSNVERNGEPFHVVHPFTSIVGGLQPAVLERLRGESTRGMPPPDDGFLDRFLFTYPARLPAIGETWREVSSEAQADWKRIVENLLLLQMVKEPQEDGDRERPFFVNPTAEARAAWKTFTDAHAAETNDPDFPSHLLGPWAKLRGYCARLALIAHALRQACSEAEGDDLDGERMRRAALLTDYFKGHTRKVYAVMDADPKVLAARLVLRWLERHPEFDTFTARDVHQGLRRQSGFGKPESIESPLDLLARHGYIRSIPETGGKLPGRPTRRYERNPRWVYPQNPQNPQNFLADSLSECPNSDFEDFEDFEDMPKGTNGRATAGPEAWNLRAT
jgi:hypothetical protein